MYLPLKVIDVEFVGTGSDVPFAEPVGSEDAMHLRNHDEVANVEFAVFVEEGPVNVKLHDKGTRASIFVSLVLFHYVV